MDRVAPRSAILPYAAPAVRSPSSWQAMMIRPLRWRVAVGVPMLLAAQTLAVVAVSGSPFDPGTYAATGRFVPGWLIVAGMALAYRRVVRADVFRSFDLDARAEARPVREVLLAILLLALPALMLTGVAIRAAFPFSAERFAELRRVADGSSGAIPVNERIGPFFVESVEPIGYGAGVIVHVRQGRSGFVWSEQDAHPTRGRTGPLGGGWRWFSEE